MKKMILPVETLYLKNTNTGKEIEVRDIKHAYEEIKLRAYPENWVLAADIDFKVTP
jgi:hypothetical protein